MKDNTIFITGYARLPQGIAAEELYSVIAVGLVIDIRTGEIIEADCSLVTDTSRRFVRDMIEGENINNIDEIIAKIKARYFGSARKALISAVKMCQEKYNAILEDDGSIYQ
jgi:hypothetical protein